MAAIHRDPASQGNVADFFNSASAFARDDYQNAETELKRRYSEQYIPEAVARAEQTTSQSEVAYLNSVEAHSSALFNPDAFFEANPELKGRVPQVIVAHDLEILRQTVSEITATAGRLSGHLVAPQTASFRRNKVEM